MQKHAKIKLEKKKKTSLQANNETQQQKQTNCNQNLGSKRFMCTCADVESGIEHVTARGADTDVRVPRPLTLPRLVPGLTVKRCISAH